MAVSPDPFSKGLACARLVSKWSNIDRPGEVVHLIMCTLHYYLVYIAYAYTYIYIYVGQITLLWTFKHVTKIMSCYGSILGVGNIRSCQLFLGEDCTVQ